MTDSSRDKVSLSYREQELRLALDGTPARLRIARAALNASQADAAARADLSLDRLREIERGRGRRLSRSEAERLADAYGIGLAYLRGSAISTAILVEILTGRTDTRAHEPGGAR